MRIQCKRPFFSTTYHSGVIGSQSLFIFTHVFVPGKKGTFQESSSENGLYEVSELNSELFFLKFWIQLRYLLFKMSWFYAEEKKQVLNAKWKNKFGFFWESSDTHREIFGFFILFFCFFLMKWNKSIKCCICVEPIAHCG